MGRDFSMPAKVKRTAGQPASQDSPPRRPGRSAAPRATEYCWFRNIECFCGSGRNPWWENIDWDEEARSKQKKRSLKQLEMPPTRVHAGFLWEAVRRFPEFEKLMEGYKHLKHPGPLGKELTDEVFSRLADATQNLVAFRQKQGHLVVKALEILSAHWKHDYGALDEETKSGWQECYLAFWFVVGQKGRVPATPADLPSADSKQFSGQGRTAFDLLILESGANSEGFKDFRGQPLPMMLLGKFAKLRPSGGTRAESYDANLSFVPGKVKADTYPWLSFGILEKHLARYQLHPLALGVDLSKSNDTIVRDLKKIINAKRKELGICVADRRIRTESFQKIKTLDQEVCGIEEKPPLTRTVNEFEASARLDLSGLLDRVLSHADSVKSEPRRGAQVSKKEIKSVLAELSQETSRSSNPRQ